MKRSQRRGKDKKWGYRKNSVKMYFWYVYRGKNVETCIFMYENCFPLIKTHFNLQFITAFLFIFSKMKVQYTQLFNLINYIQTVQENVCNRDHKGVLLSLL